MKNLLFIFLIVAFFAGCSGKENPVIKINGFTMGTTYSITVVNSENSNKIKFDTLKRKIDSVLVEVNNKMSTYQKDSELSVFNESKDTSWHPISNDLFTVVSEGRRISALTDSSFDISAGPIVNLWGFGPEARPTKIPTKDEVLQRRSFVGLSKYELSESPVRMKKHHKDLYVDLSSIAKGFGVDEVGRLLSKLKFENYMVEIGGEVVTGGVNAENSEWKIGISTPDGSSHIQKIVKLSGNALATSGDYRNYFEENGVRYSHTVDAKTGKPITHNLASVSVIYDNCMSADGIATALNVVGEKKGLELAQKNNWAVLFIVKDGDGFKEVMTKEFEKYLLERK